MDQRADILIVNALEDETDAYSLKVFIQNHYPDIEIWTLHEPINDPIGDFYDPEMKMGIIRQKFGYIFFFITDKFCQNNFLNIHKNVIVSSYFRNGIVNRIIPVLTKPPNELHYDIPFLLKSLGPLRLYRITKGDRLSNLSPRDMEENNKNEHDHILQYLNKIKSIEY